MPKSKKKKKKLPSALWSPLVYELQRFLVSLSMHCQKEAYLCSHIYNNFSGHTNSKHICA